MKGKKAYYSTIKTQKWFINRNCSYQARIREDYKGCGVVRIKPKLPKIILEAKGSGFFYNKRFGQAFKRYYKQAVYN